MRPMLVTAVVYLGALVAAGCDECDYYGQTRCHGNMVQECIDDGDGFVHFYWTDRIPCSVMCHEATGSARCVKSTEPVAECANMSGQFCLDGAPADCWDGYLFRGSPCASGSVCVAPPGCDAMCAPSDAPEPRCAAQSFC